MKGAVGSEPRKCLETEPVSLISRDLDTGRVVDEWFEEPDDLERVSRAPSSVDREENPVVAAGIPA